MTPQQKTAMWKALEALKLNNAEWKTLADSGDAGFWAAEDQDHYKQTEQAITALTAALAQPEHEHVIDCPRCGHCCPQSIVSGS